MKIVSAKCNRTVSPGVREEAPYLATVEVSSDGKQHYGNGHGDDPSEAIHKAIAAACVKFTQPLHDAMQVGIEIKF